MKIIAASLLISISAWGQSPEVPHKMKFAGMTLTIRDDARSEIQDQVDALTKSPTYFNQKADRARAYFPIIEDILKEERVPDDFKYLVLQESALIPDAVSSSDAVGFWQFKDYTAEEMGLRLDRQVDERMNVVASTHAAAQYLKKNNFYFNNWLYALQAYQMGAGAVMRSVKNVQSGAREMDITSDTYWYVKTYLAHKIAFEHVEEQKGPVQLLVYTTKSKQSFSEVADELSIGEDELRSYNKWAKGDDILASKECPLLIPVTGGVTSMPVATAAIDQVSTKVTSSEPVSGDFSFNTRIVLVNDIPAVKVKPGETATSLARESGLRLAFFLHCNDLSVNDRLSAGEFFYLDRKSNKADVPNHMVAGTETLWSISQKYGVKLSRLEHYNNIDAATKLTPGKFIWLQNPSGDELENTDAEDMDVLAVDDDNNFSWGVNPEPRASMEVKPGTLSVDSGTASQTPPGTTTPVVVHDSVTAPDSLSAPDSSETASTGGERTVFHTVVASDTLYGVARQYGVTVKQLMDWNNKTDFNLAVGENLKIVLK